MTFIRSASAALVGVACWSSCALGALEQQSLSITNDTALSIGRITFRIALPATPVDADEWNAIRFASDLSLFEGTESGAAVFFPDAPTNRRIAFDYSDATPLAPGGTFGFSLAVDNPFNVPYTIAYRIVSASTIPAAPTAGLIGLAGLAAARRRRR